MNNSILRETNHTFAVCAYKESPFLEDCILSLINQSTPSNIQLSTSTPNSYIYAIAAKYNLSVLINQNKDADMQDNWNFAVSQVKTDYVTICHQDDYYDSEYFNHIQKYFENDLLMIHTAYRDVVDGKILKGVNNKIKSFILHLTVKKNRQNKKFFKKLSLSFGNTICCPSCTYHIKKLRSPIFISKLKHACDWDLYIDLALQQGRIVYIPVPLTYKRIHSNSATKSDIKSGLRANEDYYLFSRLWPKPVAYILAVLIKNIYKYS